MKLQLTVLLEEDKKYLPEILRTIAHDIERGETHGEGWDTEKT